MNQINYLEVGTHVHCLRCHQQVSREDFISHVEKDCPNLNGEAKLDYDNCEKCLSFKGKIKI